MCLRCPVTADASGTSDTNDSGDKKQLNSRSGNPMPYFKNFYHHMAQLTLLHDIDLADGWAEHFDHTVSEEELQDGQICDTAITFAINLWRSGEEDYANATPHHTTRVQGPTKRVLGTASGFVPEGGQQHLSPG